MTCIAHGPSNAFLGRLVVDFSLERGGSMNLLVFRSYPAPGQKWKPWTVEVDSKKVGRVGGAGVLQVEVPAGTHQVVVRSGRLTSNIATIDDEGKGHVHILAQAIPTEPGALYTGISVIGGAIDAELPRSSIPLYTPTSTTQTLGQGTHKAYLACAYLTMINVLIVGASVATLVMFLASHRVISAIAFIFLAVLAILFSRQLYPVMRTLRNQKGWPLPAWRVDRKGKEKDEWHRWSGIKWSEDE